MLVVAWAAIAPQGARAHNPDTSYARFTIESTGVTSRFTYDATSLRRIVPTLDADGDRTLTRAEFTAAAPAIVAYLRRSIACEIDDVPSDLGALTGAIWPPDVDDAIAERDYHAPTSLISFEFVKPTDRPPASVWIEFRFFDELTLQHTVLGAFVHQGEVLEELFTAQLPDYYFATNFPPTTEPTPTGSAIGAAKPGEVRPDVSSAEQRGNRTSPGSWSRFIEFFRFGVDHILIGYDHILFLLSLIIVSRFGELVKIVTSFTVAHSITLALAALHIVEVPSQVIETAIAATIVFTAVENYWIRDTSGRWKLTFAFGLIHGFGFANLLQEMQLPTQGFVRSLLAFNLGVEAGQLAIVAALAVPVALMKRWKHGRAMQLTLSGAIALCGLGWFVSRAFELDFMPF